MNGEQKDSVVIAQWAAFVVTMMLLSSHFVTRPIVYLLAPLISFLLCCIARASLVRRTLYWVVTVAASIGGFLWAKYLFP